MKEEERIYGQNVLRAIEDQHGIIVGRYENIYSFSHLTLQEFFTARHVIDNNLDITKLLIEHLCDEHWREVFLLLAGLRKADDLLMIMEQQIRTYLDTEKLQNLLNWVSEITDPTSGHIQPFGKRAIVYANAYANAIANTTLIAIDNDNDSPIAIANANANANANAIAYANGIGYNIAYANAYSIAITNVIARANANRNDDDQAYDIVHPQTSTYTDAIHRANAISISNKIDNAKTNAIAIANAYAYAYAYAYTYAHAYSNANSNVNVIANANTVDKFIQYAQWSVEFEIYRELDLKAIINELERLKNQILDENQSDQSHQSFERRLIEIWLQGFGLNANMVNLSREEIHSLDNYLYANRLLVECERAAVRRSPKVWNQIEERMFRLVRDVKV